jgi:hypothetical protein
MESKQAPEERKKKLSLAPRKRNKREGASAPGNLATETSKQKNAPPQRGVSSFDSDRLTD